MIHAGVRLLASKTSLLSASWAGDHTSTVLDADDDGLANGGADCGTDGRIDVRDSRMSAMTASESDRASSIDAPSSVDGLGRVWYEIAAEGSEDTREGDFELAVAAGRELASVAAGSGEQLDEAGSVADTLIAGVDVMQSVLVECSQATYYTGYPLLMN